MLSPELTAYIGVLRGMCVYLATKNNTLHLVNLDRMVMVHALYNDHLNDTVYTLDYKIRNAMIDYFKKVDTINPKLDDRFTQIQ